MAIEKTIVKTIRVSPKEERAIRAMAKKAGVSWSRFVREVALSERGQDGRKLTKAHKLDLLIKQVRAIGNNINQIALHGNRQGQVNPQRFEETKKQLDRIAIQIFEAV